MLIKLYHIVGGRPDHYSLLGQDVSPAVQRKKIKTCHSWWKLLFSKPAGLLISCTEEIAKAGLLNEISAFTIKIKDGHHFHFTYQSTLYIMRFCHKGIKLTGRLEKEKLQLFSETNLKVDSSIKQIFHHCWVFVGRCHVENILSIIPATQMLHNSKLLWLTLRWCRCHWSVWGTSWSFSWQAGAEHDDDKNTTTSLWWRWH